MSSHHRNFFHAFLMIMSIFAMTVFLVTGTIGFFACFWFNLQIYGSIKVD